MNEPTLAQIHLEIRKELIGHPFGKVFVFSRHQLVIDFLLPTGEYFFISAEPANPRAYLIKRRLKELKMLSLSELPFVSLLRKTLTNAIVSEIEKLPNERILKIYLDAVTEDNQHRKFTLVIQLTGRSSNLFLLDENEIILNSLRISKKPEWSPGMKYAPPEPLKAGSVKIENALPQDASDESLSATLDKFYSVRETAFSFEQKSAVAKGLIEKVLNSNAKLQKKLAKDLERHGEPEKWKRCGDLLLANAATAKKNDGMFIVLDHYEPRSPEIEIDSLKSANPSDAAEKYFRRYSKSRNASIEISERLERLKSKQIELEKKVTMLAVAVESGHLEELEQFLPNQTQDLNQTSSKGKSEISSKGTRRYVSKDGFEILVGKGSKDNDHLTFRIAKSSDTWLHAADYPGSHVIIRNPNRKEIPHSTIIEAAQVAAFFSKARSEGKVGVHYALRKHLSKPKRAAPGLVSMKSFKTILVTPKILKSNDR